MVLRIKKRSRKYLGNRSWGAGNIKNKRGAGDRGGVGRGGVKHKFTHLVVYERESIGKQKGFYSIKKSAKEINLRDIDKMAKAKGEEKPHIDLKGYKVLGSGKLSVPAIVTADMFSENAIKKIKEAGGEAIKTQSQAAVHEKDETSK
ncbi:MAG: uL15m family ribosomal protein [Candidatus Micrarchaeia archaeon]